MTEYSKVQNRIWNSKTFLRLTENSKFLWLYLLTCPHGNIMGLFVLKPGYAQDDLGWSNQRYSKAFKELVNIPLSNGCKGLIQYDESTKVVWIKNYLEHNPMINPNQVTSGVKKIKALPYSELFQDVKLFIQSLGKSLYKEIAESLGKPITITVAVTIPETIEEEIVQDPESGHEPVIKIPLKDNSDFNITEEMMKEFQEAYPIQDAMQTLRDIRMWNISNKERRKTRSGIMSHISSWLKRNHDKGKNMINGGANDNIYDRLIAANEAADKVVQQKGSDARSA